MAQKRDVPLFKVMGNTQVLALARRKPVVMEDFEDVRGFSAKQVKQLGPGLVKAVRNALELPEKSASPISQKGG